MPAVDTLVSSPSFSAVKLEATLAEPIQSRADAERLAHIIMEMQRCFLMHLCKELAPGNVSFSQYFLLAALDPKEVLTMSEIAQKMGHTTAAASGLVARLENLGYVTRACGAQDRRKVMVKVLPGGVQRIEKIMGPLSQDMNHTLQELSEDELRAVLKFFDVTSGAVSRHLERIHEET